MRKTNCLSITLLVCVVAAVVAVGCGDKKTTTKAPKAASAAGLDRPALGAAAPKVDVLVFVDYECPFCKASSAALLAVAAKHNSTLRLRFLNLPLEVHTSSVDLAKASVAARKQGKWQAFHDHIFSLDKPNRDAAIAWAAKAGVDAAKFTADLDSEAVADEVARDVAIAAALGVTGTPTYVVNGGLLQGAKDAAAWAKVVASQAAKYDELAKAGAKPAEVLAKLVAANSEERAPNYARYVVKGDAPPTAPVPAKVQRKSGVASAQIMPVGGGMGGIQVGQPVRVGDEGGDNKTVWRVAVRPDDPVLGPATAPVTMVIFEDFQCPYCKQLQGTIKALRAQYGDKVRVVFKHSPLPFHADAMNAAVAAEAARAQGKFWPMHDALFASQADLGAQALSAAAKTAGLDAPQFDNAMTSRGAQPRVQADIEQAAALGARGTPIIFVNGRKLVGAKAAPEISALIDAELPKAEALLKQGVAADALYDKQVGEGKLLDSLGAKAAQIDTTGAATRGPSAAAIHIVAFQDLQCPFCARLDQHILAVEKEFPGRIKVSWMDFPLRDIHPQAQMAAEAGKEALAQGKFWPFMAQVMADQSKLDRDGLLAVAGKAGLDAKKLAKALDGGVHKAAVDRERAIGAKLGIKGTPSIFINGHAFTPQLGFSANTFRSAIRRLLGTRQ